MSNIYVWRNIMIICLEEKHNTMAPELSRTMDMKIAIVGIPQPLLIQNQDWGD